MPDSHLQLTTEDGIAILTLNRPAQRNALSLELMRELIECLTRIEADRQIGAVILAAAGPAYCAGHDLREMTGRAEADYQEIFRVCTELMQKIQALPQPVIAEVQGMATAAGCQLVATCDLAVASETATFATPGVRIGLFCSTPMVAVSRAIGRKRALQMLLTGDPIDAGMAADWGLVNSVVPAAELRASTHALAKRVTQASTHTLAIGKQAFYRQFDMAQGDAYEFTQQVMTANAQSADAQEGICAFLEKRKPQWRGR
ncbi:MAG: enoyl-CoA hydratase [Bryobacterales bacterium]|nr:enoyl-CoA hydratase [Bryobacterales bacterium]